ncbi:mechanosensitive ion channel family protein [Pseudoalteromonas sp. T1lg88]|uniref:mechanosensitive ion channel family protein n=1 Tax=Pseudoalteromonas sp. T1lg88 TaxID=2077104 RepID=UPI000CF6074D|nr:mechanosensitive ion channel domain-containing protein [Pseudoalteromonas sp. T1lg88]
MTQSHLQKLLKPLFADTERAELLSTISATGIGLMAIILLYFFLSSLMLPALQSLMMRIAPQRTSALKPLLIKLNRRLAGFICCVAFLASFQTVVQIPELYLDIIHSCVKILLIVYGGFIVSSMVSIGGALYNQFEFSREVPIQGLIQLVKLITFIICAILIFALLLERSPTYIISGFGAIAAVTMLVFKDTILGFVASIQIAANRLVTYGDWIQVDSYGADGEVIDLGLNTVKVRNWDNTITTLPTYTLVSGSFKNWRGMQESGGRRIKRSLNIDMNSIRIADDELQQSIEETLQLCEYINTTSLPDKVTNLGLFRRYAEGYLKQHDRINKDLTLMVRELQPLNHGLPIEFYCFSADKRWISYEHIQAEIMDHLLAVLPIFELRPYQSVSGQMNGSS